MTSASPADLLISEEYRKMQEELHKNPDYGVASVGYAPLVAEVLKATGITEILDYGAGKGRLGQALKKIYPVPVTVHHYDPAIPEWATRPEPHDMVVCIDVLEHIEPEYLPNVLDELKRLTRRTGVFTVHTGPAMKVLADGRNAHLTQKPSSWWLPQFMARFEIAAFTRVEQEFWIAVDAMKESSQQQ